MATKKNAAAVAAEKPREPAHMIRIRVSDIAVMPNLNSRESFDPAEIAELAQSIRENGLLEPLGLHETNQPMKLLVFGERRWRACVSIDPDMEVNATIREYSTEELFSVVMIENLHRKDLNDIERARGYERALMVPGMTQAKLAARLGVSQPVISNAIRVLQLPQNVLDAAAAGTLMMSEARDILLPFCGIPEAKRAMVFAAALRACKNRSPHQDLRYVVSDVAAKLSHPLADSEKTYHDSHELRVLIDQNEHAQCTCGGPSFKYGHGPALVRCFDDSWWNEAQKRGQERQKEVERKTLERMKKAEEGARAAVQMTEDKFEKLFKAQPYRADIESELLDASLLAEAQLVVVKMRYSGEKVCCADATALRKARGAVKKEREQTLTQLRTERGQKDRAEASAAKLEPWMLAQVLTARPHGDTLLAIGRELGVDCGKHGGVDAAVLALPAADAELLFKVVAIRAKRGDLAEWNDPLKAQVDKAIEKKYRIGMNRLKRQALEAAGTATLKPRKQKKQAVDSGRPDHVPEFVKEHTPDAALAAIVGEAPLSRTDITKKIWAYVQKHGLQDAVERRMINADEKLSAVFDGKKRVSMFEMTKLVNRHLGITESQADEQHEVGQQNEAEKRPEDAEVAA